MHDFSQGQLCFTGKTKVSHWMRDGRVWTLELINGDAPHPIKLVFWGEDNGPVTSDIRANSDSTPMSRQAPQRVGYRGPICDEGVTGLGGGECHG